MVAAVNHLYRRAGAPVDDNVPDGRAGGHGFIDRLLELDLVAAAVAGVLCEDGDAGGVVDAVGDGIGRKPAEDDRVDGADSRAGEQGNRQLRRHAHVDRYAVALLNAEGLEGICEPLDLGMELSVGEAANLARLALPDKRGFPGARAEDVAIQTIE